MKNKIFSILMTVVLLISSIGVNAVYADDEVTVDTPTEGGEIVEVVEDTGNNPEVVDELFEEDVGGDTTTNTSEPVDPTTMSNEELLEFVNENFMEDIALIDENGNKVELTQNSNEVNQEDEEELPEGDLVFGYLRDLKMDNSWLSPDYDSYKFKRDAELVAFIEKYNSFEDKTSVEFATFLVDNLLNISDLAAVINPDIEVSEAYFSKSIDYESMITLQELFDTVRATQREINFKLEEDPENAELAEIAYFLELIRTNIDGLAGSKIRRMLRAGRVNYWSYDSGAYCLMYNKMVGGGGGLNIGGSGTETLSGTNAQNLMIHMDCTSESCTATGAWDYSDGSKTTLGSHGSPNPISKAVAKETGSCPTMCNCNGRVASTCHVYRITFDGNKSIKRPNGTYTDFRVYDQNGNRVFCLKYDAHADACSIYDSSGQYTVGDTVELAAAVGYFHAGGDGDAVQSAIWDLVHNGVSIPSYMKEGSNVVDQHKIDMNPKTVEVQAKGSGSSTDSIGNLSNEWKSRYTVSSNNSNLVITSTVNPANSNTITFDNKDPYPLTKKINIAASGPERQGCGGGDGSVHAVWGSGGAQPWATDGQFDPANCHIDEFYGDTVSVVQPAGQIEFFKISERTGQAVSCPYVDAMGVSHACESEFALYMLNDANDPTWQKYNGTSMDMGEDVVYEGKTYRRIRISTNGSGDNSHWQSIWTLDANGKMTTGGMNVPEGTFYAKEIKTNTRIWDLNPKYYPITVVKNTTKAIDGGTNSSEGNSGSNFPNQEFGALKIVKYTAEQFDTVDDDAANKTSAAERTQLTSDSYTDRFGNIFEYKARFMLYITDESPLWGSDYDYTAKVDANTKITANMATNNVGKELHALRIKQDGNTSDNTAQYEYGTDGIWTWEWQTVNGVININSIPVMKYSDGVDKLEVYVKETGVNTDFQTLDRVFHKIDIQKNANVFESHGTNRMNETNDLYGSLQIDKFILGGLGKETAAYGRVHAEDTYTDLYGDTYDAVAKFALYITSDNPLWLSEYDCSAASRELCPIIPASDQYNTTGKALHQVRIFKLNANDNNNTNAKYALATDRMAATGELANRGYYEYRWTTINGHIDITQIPIFERNWKGDMSTSNTFYLKEIETNESIFQLNQEYRALTLGLNTNTKVEVDNAPRGTIELHKYDEDSMADGTPRKVTSEYCSQANIDQGTYCDLPSNKALNDYFVLLIDKTSPLWNVKEENAVVINGIDDNIGVYDAGAYYAYDEDWGGLGYVKSISVAKDDRHNSSGTDSNFTARMGNLATNEVSSGSLMYEMEFTPNENEAVLHIVKIAKTTNYTGTDLVDAGIWANLSGGENLDSGNVNKYTQNITEMYEDGNTRVFEAGVHWHPDANGDMYIKYLPEGSYYLKEHSVDPNVFSLDEYLYKIDVEDTKVNKVRNLVASELDLDPATSDIEAPEWTFANTSIKTGGLEFVKLDEEGHNAGAGHVFEIYYVNDNVEDKRTAQANGNSVQNANGQWGKDISHSYELARTVSAKKHYLDGYVENGKRIPTDAEGNKVVKFQIHTDMNYLANNPGHYVYKGTGTAVNQFVTDENGRIYIERMPIGTYILVEVETSDDKVFDLVVDDEGNYFDKEGNKVNFSVEDDQGKVFENGYRFSVDYKLVTCLNGKENPVSSQTGNNVCKMVNQFKNKNNTQVPSGLFADTETRTNQVKVGEHNADVTTTVSFYTEDREGNMVNDVKTFTGVVNEPTTEFGSFKLYKYDEYGNTGNQEIEVIPGTEGTQDTIAGEYGDVEDKVFELYYLDENEVFNTIDGKRFVTQGSYTPEELAEIYTIPEEVASRLQDGKVLAIQVDDVNKKGVYNYKHWKSSTVDFDNGEYNKAVYQFITDETGIVEIDKVPVGSYLLIEVGTTNAFILNIRGEDVQNIEAGKITEFEVTNYNRNVDLEIRKVDRDKEDTPLKDAEFTVYDITNTFRTDYQTNDMEVVPEGELLFARMNRKVDLYDVLIKGRELESIVANRPVKYSMSNVDYAAIDSDGYLYSNATGKVEIQMMGGVYSLYGNLPDRRFYTGTSVVLNNLSQMDRTSVIDVNLGEVVINEGREIKFFKDAAHNEPVSVESLLVTLPVEYDINTAGTYKVDYKLITTDHIIYNFSRNITFEDKDTTACLYYPQSGKWLRNGKVCDNKDPDIKDSNEINVNLTDPISLISSYDAGDWNGTDLGKHEVYILKDGDTTSKIFPAGQDSATIVGAKVFKAVTGHITIVLQDPKNHNYPIANGELITYTDPEMTNEFKRYQADELGMVDLTEDAGKVEKLYFASYINDDGYYTETPQAVEIDMTPREGYAQIKNLKHSRKYLICETKLPDGFVYSPNENACMLLDTTSANYGEDIRNGKRIIYSENPELLFTLNAAQSDVHNTDFNKVANTMFEEENFDTMIQNDEHNGMYDLWEVDTNEEQANTFGNSSIIIGEGDFSKWGVIETENGEVVEYRELKNIVFDVYEYYGSDAKDRAAQQDGSEYAWAAEIVKDERRGNHHKYVNFVGRFSTGMIYERFLDDEGNPIANEVVEISQDPSFDTIYMEAQTDDKGMLISHGEYLADGTWYYRLKRPLKPEYQACYETTEVPEYCNVAPSENDYVQYADLPKAYAKIYEMTVSMQGSFKIPNMRAASTFIFSEVANYDKDVEGKEYVLPDDDVAYVINFTYAGYDLQHQDIIKADIFNDRSRHSMGTQVDKSFAMLIDGMTIKLTDTVHMEGLKPGALYDIKGYLGDKQTKEPFMNSEEEMIEGTTRFSAITKAPETPHHITYVGMDVPVEFEINASDILAKYPEGNIEFVAMEELWSTTVNAFTGEPDPRKLDEHKDWTDAGQTIELAVPKIGTTVINYEGNKNIYEEEEFKFTDTIAYENLMPGETFTYRTTIHVRSMEDEDLGELLNKDGEPIVVEGTFVPETRNGTFDVEITLDTREIAEDIKGIVVFEELYYEGFLAAEHKDIKDDGQTLIKRHKPIVQVRKVDDKGELLEGAKLSLIDKRTNEVLGTWDSVLEPWDVTELVKVDKTYILREEEGIDHYYLSKDVEFTVPDKYEANIEVLVTDMVDNKINYVIVKVDDSGEMLENAKMELYEYNDETKEYTLVDEWTTVLEEHDISNVVKAGHVYKVVESETPHGYYQFVDYTFEVPKYGTPEKITVTMIDVAAKVRFSKLDSVTKQTVEGAKYAIFEILDKEADIKNKTVEELEKAETIKVITYFKTIKDEEGQEKDIDGKEIVKLLDTSKTYYVQEVEAPFGYEIDKVAHELKITGTKDNVQVFKTEDVPMIVYVRVAKADKDNVKHYLAGAEITIFKNDGTVAKTKDGKDAIGVTDKNGVAMFLLNFDQNATYYAQETKAPAGYYLNNNKFDVHVSSTYTFMETDIIGIDILDRMMIIPKLIQTGAGRAALIAVPTLAVAAVALFLVNRKKGKKRED